MNAQRTLAAPVALGLLALALSTAPALHAQRDAVERIAIGARLSGTLAPADPTANERGRFNVYRLDARRGQRLSITMRSADFDAFLAIGRTVRGITDYLKTDDDGAATGEDGTDARLRFTAPETGSYLVVAQALEKEKTGSYTLSVDSLPAPVLMPPREIRPGQGVQGTLSDTDPTLDPDGAAYDLYTFQGRRGQRVEITMESPDFDTFLALGQLRGDSLEVLNTDDDGGAEGTTNSRLRSTLPADGAYVIRATSAGEGPTGAYTLRLSELPPVPPPPAPRPITAGQTVSAALETTDPQAEDDSYYDAYLYRGRAGETLTLTLRSDAFDAYLAFGRMENGEFQATESADDGADGTNSKLTVTLPADGEYVIRANSLNAGQTGPYTLKIESVRSSQ